MLPGYPSDVVPVVAAPLAAATVHVSADFGRYGTARDRCVDAVPGLLDVFPRLSGVWVASTRSGPWTASGGPDGGLPRWLAPADLNLARRR